MSRSGRSGWYVRVLNPGGIEAGSPIVIQERLNPAWSITRFNRVFNNHQGTLDEISELAELPGLPDELREKARAALSRERERAARAFSRSSSGSPGSSASSEISSRVP